jgi:C-terminal processing protease CtpA/Prc
LEQVRFAVRFPLGTKVEVGFRASENSPERTVTLAAVGEVESLFPDTTDIDLTGMELPVEFRRLEGGYVYASVNSFLDDEVLTVRLWERLMAALNEYEIDGLIIDLRRNLGGNGFLADQMAAYLFDESVELGNAARYNAELETFYIDPRTTERFILPKSELRYRGAAVVLVGPTCSSACEFFAYNLTRQERTITAGMYPTAGLGGSIDQFLMPNDETFQFTAGRSVDPNGEIHIEGKGVVPTLRVPVTEQTVFAEDAVLEAAMDYLDQVTSESQDHTDSL